MAFSVRSNLAKTLLALDKRVLARPKPQLSEAWTMKAREMGETPWKKSSLSDPHIQEVIQHASEVTGVSVADIIHDVNKTLAEVEAIKQYSPILYETIAHNAVENAVFKMVSSVRHNQMNPHPNLVTFNETTFLQLAKMVQQEHPMFRPLKQPADPVRRVWRVTPIIIPSDLPEYKKFNGVKTACATARGDFVFNKHFMQNLLDWAVIEGAKGQGKKYQSNGGPIPDAYVYVEFLIMHEYMHFAYGDFNYGKQMPEFSHKVHNWASDFRSNYDLVKNNYRQLPIGLFSDHINSDRQNSYSEMAQIVHDELKKLPPKLQKTWEGMAEIDEEPNKIPRQPKKETPPIIKVPYKPTVGDVVRLPDGNYGQVSKVDPDGTFDTTQLTPEQATQLLNYPKGTSVRRPSVLESRRRMILEGRWKPSEVTWMKPVPPPTPQPPQPPKPPKPPEPEDIDEPPPPPVPVMDGEDPPTPPSQDDQEGGEEGEEGKGGKEGEDSEDGEDNGKDPTKSEEEEKKRKKKKVLGPTPDEIHEKLKDKLKDKQERDPGTPGGPTGLPGGKTSTRTPGDLTVGSAKKRLEDIKPKMNWKSLIKLMISSSQLAVDTSYVKPSRRNVTGAPIAAKLGAAAIKPGQVKRPVPLNKVLFVFDTSGSMWAAIPTALKEAQILLNQLGKVDYPFGVMFFAGDYENFMLNQGQDYYAPIGSLTELSQPVEKSKQVKGWANVLQQHGTGGTYFSSTIVSQLSHAASDGYNIMIFSDEGLLETENWKEFLALWKPHKRNVFCIFDTEQVWRQAVTKLGQNTPNFSHL